MLSLRSHFAIADDTDVFRFPSVAPHHGDLTTVDYTPSVQEGNAGLLWGRTWTVGVYLNRPAIFDDAAQMETLYAGLDLPEAQKILDLIAATKVGDNNAIGLILAPSHGLSTLDVDAPGDNRGRVSTGARVFVLDVGLGWTWSGPRLLNDASLALTFISIEQQDAGETIFEGGGAPSLGVRDRMILAPEEDVGFGFELLVTRRAYEVDEPGAGGTDGSYDRLLLQLDAGPRFKLTERVIFAPALRVLYERLSGTIGDQDGPSATGLSAPGAVVALEAHLGDHWRLRGGADYLFTYEAFEGPSIPGVEPTQSRSTDAEFSWSLGLGYQRSGFSLDALLASDLVINGPDFLGGTAPGLFGSLSGAYQWE